MSKASSKMKFKGLLKLGVSKILYPPKPSIKAQPYGLVIKRYWHINVSTRRNMRGRAVFWQV